MMLVCVRHPYTLPHSAEMLGSGCHGVHLHPRVSRWLVGGCGAASEGLSEFIEGSGIVTFGWWRPCGPRTCPSLVRVRVLPSGSAGEVMDGEQGRNCLACRVQCWVGCLTVGGVIFEGKEGEGGGEGGSKSEVPMGW